jgi:transcriptional regulator GlxA family with amidase domain
MPMLAVLLLLGAAVAVALLPIKGGEGEPRSCGAGPVAIVTGHEVAEHEIAEECHAKARRGTALAAICAGCGLLAAAGTVALRPEPTRRPATTG